MLGELGELGELLTLLVLFGLFVFLVLLELLGEPSNVLGTFAALYFTTFVRWAALVKPMLTPKRRIMTVTTAFILKIFYVSMYVSLEHNLMNTTEFWAPDFLNCREKRRKNASELVQKLFTFS